MGQVEETPRQEPDLAGDVVGELERLMRSLGGADGTWTLEAVFSNGYFVRGYTKRGPITRDEMRALGTLAGE